MPKIEKTKDGSLSLHIYNQELAGALRFYARQNREYPGLSFEKPHNSRRNGKSTRNSI